MSYGPITKAKGLIKIRKIIKIIKNKIKKEEIEIKDLKINKEIKRKKIRSMHLDVCIDYYRIRPWQKRKRVKAILWFYLIRTSFIRG